LTLVTNRPTLAIRRPLQSSLWVARRTVEEVIGPNLLEFVRIKPIVVPVLPLKQFRLADSLRVTELLATNEAGRRAGLPALVLRFVTYPRRRACPLGDIDSR
jgi:hypothetical protein